MMVLMQKHVLKLSQQQRDMAALIFDTIIIKSDLKLVENNMMSQAKAYAEAVMTPGKGHEWQPPCLGMGIVSDRAD